MSMLDASISNAHDPNLVLFGGFAGIPRSVIDALEYVYETGNVYERLLVGRLLSARDELKNVKLCVYGGKSSPFSDKDHKILSECLGGEEGPEGMFYTTRNTIILRESTASNLALIHETTHALTIPKLIIGLFGSAYGLQVTPKCEEVAFAIEALRQRTFNKMREWVEYVDWLDEVDPNAIETPGEFLVWALTYSPLRDFLIDFVPPAGEFDNSFEELCSLVSDLLAIPKVSVIDAAELIRKLHPSEYVALGFVVEQGVLDEAKKMNALLFGMDVVELNSPDSRALIELDKVNTASAKLLEKTDWVDDIDWRDLLPKPTGPALFKGKLRRD
jgi:hypothetical protein